MKGLTPQGTEGWCLMGSNCAESSNDFSETTVQSLMKLFHNDHAGDGNRMLIYKVLDHQGGLGIGLSSVNFQTTSAQWWEPKSAPWDVGKD